jgi:rhomboid protease GluP
LIDLNHLLLFIAVVSSLILLVRLIRIRDSRNRGWFIAASIVLLVSLAGWLLAPFLAGYIGGAVWCFLLVGPTIAERRIERALLNHRFSQARQIASVRRLLHPWNDSPYRPSILQGLELAGSGRLDLALDRLAAEREGGAPAGGFAAALTFALTENWAGLVQWYRNNSSLATNPAVHSLYLRALGETGALDDLVFEVASQARNGEPERPLQLSSGFNLALVFAFCGRTSGLVRLFNQQFHELAPERRQFWIGTAEWAEGKQTLARQRLDQLRDQTHDTILRRSIERRLSTPLPGQLSARGEKLLARMIAEHSGRQRTASNARLQGTPAVWALILVNLVMFGMEILFGGATNSRTLHALGALEPDAVIVKHEYWRLLTALFLHYGVLHISFNLYALYLLGPGLERMIGSLRFAMSYLITGLGSSAGVVLLRALNLTKADELVGASGCVMGIIGVSAGLLLRHRKSPLAGRQLRNILVIVVIQTAFDLSTPQVSLAAHLCGFATGVMVGTILASLPRPASD